MKVILSPPLCLHEMGKRKNNEDCIYPSKEANRSRSVSNLFLVCDGVGGSAKGEEASKLVCEAFAETLKGRTIIGEKEVAEALSVAEAAVEDYVLANPTARGMATTLTLLVFHNEGATIAHIGDSRVYQIRKGKIIFRTQDHSFVNELINNRIITEQEARSHPKRNIVTKAIVGSNTPQVADINLISDIQKGDYFFLCTDGVLEGLTDQQLEEVLSREEVSNADKMAEILRVCVKESRDNFSAYLVPVERIDDLQTMTVEEAQENFLSKNKNALLIGLGVLAAINFYSIFFSNDNSDSEPPVSEESAIYSDDPDLSGIPDSFSGRELLMSDSEIVEALGEGEETLDSLQELNSMADTLLVQTDALQQKVNELKGNAAATPAVKEVTETTIPTSPITKAPVDTIVEKTTIVKDTTIIKEDKND